MREISSSVIHKPFLKIIVYMTIVVIIHFCYLVNEQEQNAVGQVRSFHLHA